MTNKALYYGLVGQKENIIYSRIGMPSETYSSNEEQKVLVYEVSNNVMIGYSKNIKPAITPYIDYKGKRDYDVDIWQMADAQSDATGYAEYSLNTSALKVYIDNDGTCSWFEQNLPMLQQEYFYDRLKKYIPED